MLGDTEEYIINRIGESYEPTKVLYLDDDFVDQKLMALHVGCSPNPDQYKLIYASTIEEAIEVLRSQEIEVLIMDNKIPGTVNFHTTLTKLGTIDKRIKVVVTSSEVASNTFQDIEHLARKPDAIVDKSDLRAFIHNGNLRANTAA